MSEPEKFLERWSRLKRDVVQEPITSEKSENSEKESEKEKERNALEQNVVGNITDLPTIDSIDAATDIRGFLQSGIPDTLKRAALRRAWSTDPQIRDFVGLAENDWNFNDSNGIGFGPLLEDEIARLLTQIHCEATQISGEAARENNEPAVRIENNETAQASGLTQKSVSYRFDENEPNLPHLNTAKEKSDVNTAQDANGISDASRNHSLDMVPRHHGSALPK